MSKHSITIQCQPCGGTGLYSGFMEGKGEAVVCAGCGGTGKQDFTYQPFTGRKKKNGINRIRGGSGSILDDPTKAKWVTYSEFERLIPSKNPT